MKRHTKIVAIVLLGTVLASVAVVLTLSRPEKSGLIKTIPYLASLQPASETDTLTFLGSGPRALSSKSHSTAFEIDEGFSTVHEALKKELKPRASSASSYPTKNPAFTMFSIGAIGKPGSAIVSVRVFQKNKTIVNVIEQRSLNPLDHLKMWYLNLGSKKKGGITAFTDKKNGGTAIYSDP